MVKNQEEMRTELSDTKKENARLVEVIAEKDRQISNLKEQEHHFGQIYACIKSVSSGNEGLNEKWLKSLQDLIGFQTQKNGIILPRNETNSLANDPNLLEKQNSSEKFRQLQSNVQNELLVSIGKQPCSTSTPKSRETPISFFSKPCISTLSLPVLNLPATPISFFSPQIKATLPLPVANLSDTPISFFSTAISNTHQPIQRRSLQLENGLIRETPLQSNSAHQKRQFTSSHCHLSSTISNTEKFDQSTSLYRNKQNFTSSKVTECFAPDSAPRGNDDEMEIYVLSCGFRPMQAERFDSKLNQWTPLAMCNEYKFQHRSWFAMPTFGPWQRHLYLLGGTFFMDNDTKNFQTGKFEALNFGTGIWTELCPMPTERQNLATFCFNDAHQIFACGGWKNKSTDTNRRGGNALNIVESYSLEYNCWQRLGNMTEIRGSPMGITLDENTAYVIGGFDGIVRLRTGERFDRREGIWTSISLMNEARSVAGAALINGRIYVVGGCDGEAMNTVELYEPRKNEWTTGPPMNFERTNLSAIFDGHRYLYAIGGRSGGTSTQKHPFNSIEVLDTSDGDGSWTMGPSMVSISGSVKAIAVQQTGQKIHREATVHSEPLIKFEQAARPPHKRPRMF